MNERIKQLWEQAGGHYNSGNQHTWPEYTITGPEKFAELIVKECEEVVRWAISVDSTIEKVPVLIREHFGVKE